MPTPYFTLPSFRSGMPNRFSADGPAALDLEPRRGVHPGVGDDYPDGGEDAAQRHHDGGEEVHSLADAVPAEDQHGQEAGLQKEGKDAFGRQGAAEDVADVAREG